MKLLDGTYVGLGLGDESAEIGNIKTFMRRVYASYAGNLAYTNKFDEQMQATVIEMQNRLVASNKLATGKFLLGVINAETKYAMEYLKRNKRLRPTFTVGGHMSDMFFCIPGDIAQILQNEERTLWLPTGYDSVKLPFDNHGGRESLVERIATTSFNINGVIYEFPVGVPFDIIAHSQGAMIANDVIEKDILPVNGRLHWRLNDLRKVVMIGNPFREPNIIAPWMTDPPAENSRGIMYRGFRPSTYPELSGKWQEVANRGDWYAENMPGEVGDNMTSIARIITENSWSGGPTSIVMRIMDFLGNPIDGTIDIVMAIVKAIMGVSKLRVHNEFDYNPILNWLRN